MRLVLAYLANFIHFSNDTVHAEHIPEIIDGADAERYFEESGYRLYQLR